MKVKIAIVISSVTLLSMLGTTNATINHGQYLTVVGEPQTATELDLKSMKSASSTNTSILSLIAMGDSSIDTVAKKAGISKIHYIDKQTFSLWFLFNTETFTIYGE
jgi:hypothetical protein